jgi:regulator of replication initiation timing
MNEEEIMLDDEPDSYISLSESLIGKRNYEQGEDENLLLAFQEAVGTTNHLSHLTIDSVDAALCSVHQTGATKRRKIEAADVDKPCGQREQELDKLKWDMTGLVAQICSMTAANEALCTENRWLREQLSSATDSAEVDLRSDYNNLSDAMRRLQRDYELSLTRSRDLETRSASALQGKEETIRLLRLQLDEQRRFGMVEPSTGKENIALVDFAAARDHEARKLRAELKTANDKMHSLKITTYSMLAQARERDEQMVAKLAQCGAALRGKNEAISALEGQLQSLRKEQTVISSPPAHSHPVDAEVAQLREALRTADDTRRRVETEARERALRAHKKEMRMAEETNMLHAALKDRDATIQRLEAKLLQPRWWRD